MERFLATLFVIVLGLANMLALYWFAFGLWPRSWPAFLFFGVIGVGLVRSMFDRLITKKKK